jgi:hypothetical protein
MFPPFAASLGLMRVTETWPQRIEILLPFNSKAGAPQKQDNEESGGEHIE